MMMIIIIIKIIMKHHYISYSLGCSLLSNKGKNVQGNQGEVHSGTGKVPCVAESQLAGWRAEALPGLRIQVDKGQFAFQRRSLSGRELVKLSWSRGTQPGSGRWVQLEGPAPLSRRWRCIRPFRVLQLAAWSSVGRSDRFGRFWQHWPREYCKEKFMAHFKIRQANSTARSVVARDFLELLLKMFWGISTGFLQLSLTFLKSMEVMPGKRSHSL